MRGTGLSAPFALLRGAASAAALAIFLMALGASVRADSASGEYDFLTLRKLAVQDGGRTKPFDTIARESVWTITGSERFEGRDPVAVFLDISVRGEEWGRRPVLAVNYEPLQARIGIPAERKFIDADHLEQSSDFRSLAMTASGKEEKKLEKMDKEVLDLLGRLNLFNAVRSGALWKLIPNPKDAAKTWFIPFRGQEGHAVDPHEPASPVGEYPAEKLDPVLEGFRDMLIGYGDGNAARFNAGVQALAGIRGLVPADRYPAAADLELEYRYNSLKPFRISTWTYFAAFLVLVLFAVGMRSAWGYRLGMGGLVAGLLVNVAGIVMRVLIAGRAPISNMYETIVYLGGGVVLIAVVFEAFTRGRVFGAAAAGLGAVALVLSDNLSLDPGIGTLVPVLRSPWLVYHVQCMILSYAALTLALGLAFAWLGTYYAFPHRQDLLDRMGRYLHRNIQVGVLLLATGTILGGVWANESWGRYWGWDAKETWALISLLGYLAILHARFTGMLRDFGTALGGVLAFNLILMTYFGVNYFLVGLHSYAGADKPPLLPPYLRAYLGAQIGAVAMAVHARVQRGAGGSAKRDLESEAPVAESAGAGLS